MELDSVGLINNAEGMLEIPGVGGANNDMPTPLAPLEADESARTTATTNTTPGLSERVYRTEQNDTCHSPSFILLSVCWEF